MQWQPFGIVLGYRATPYLAVGQRVERENPGSSPVVHEHEGARKALSLVLGSLSLEKGVEGRFSAVESLAIVDGSVKATDDQPHWIPVSRYSRIASTRALVGFGGFARASRTSR